jgi:hypothetical protein
MGNLQQVFTDVYLKYKRGIANRGKGSILLSGAMNVNLFLLYLLIVNLVCLVLFGWDKRRARTGAWRIRERDLFLWGIAGGSGLWYYFNR